MYAHHTVCPFVLKLVCLSFFQEIFLLFCFFFFVFGVWQICVDVYLCTNVRVTCTYWLYTHLNIYLYMGNFFIFYMYTVGWLGFHKKVENSTNEKKKGQCVRVGCRYRILYYMVLILIRDEIVRAYVCICFYLA